jgi:hypothetical protein
MCLYLCHNCCDSITSFRDIPLCLENVGSYAFPDLSPLQICRPWCSHCVQRINTFSFHCTEERWILFQFYHFMAEWISFVSETLVLILWPEYSKFQLIYVEIADDSRNGTHFLHGIQSGFLFSCNNLVFWDMLWCSRQTHWSKGLI